MCVLCASQENPDGSTTLFIAGGSYEVVIDSQGVEASIRKYDALGGQRIMREDDSNYYLLTDHLGSVVGISDESGDLISEQRYMPYGVSRLWPGIDETDFGYTGQRSLDAARLMDYNARWYSPNISRFLRADPIATNASQNSFQTAYSYANLSPTRFTDPSGMYVPESERFEPYKPLPIPERIDLDKLDRARHHGTGMSAIELYFFYQDMYYQDGWWWDVYGKDGTFDMYDFASVMMTFETYTSGARMDLLVESAVRTFFEWCKNHSCSGNSSAEILNWMASSIASAGTHANNSVPDKFLLQNNAPENFRAEAAAFGQGLRRPPQGFKLGFDSKRPAAWGNLSMFTLDQRDEMAVHMDSFFYWNPPDPVNGEYGGNTWILPSGCAYDNYIAHEDYNVICDPVGK